MKIGFVLDDSLDKTDGVQQYVLALGEWFTKHGHEVHYLVGQTERTDLPHVHSLSRNVQVHFNQNRMSTPLPAPKARVRELMEREEFDVLHVQMPYSPFLAGRVVRYAGPETAIIGTFHIMPFSRLEALATRLLGLWLRRNLKRFDRVVSVSDPAARFARKSFRLKTGVLPIAVNVGHFQAGKPPRKYADGKLNIVYLGRLVERKGCMYLLQALDMLHQQHMLLNVRIIIVGKGPLEDQLKTFVQKKGLGKLVTFLGYIPEEEKPNILAAASIAVFPSTSGESFGIVLVEAMAAGADVVVGGNNKGYRWVMRGHPDQIVNPHDTAAFAKLLKHFLLNNRTRPRAKKWQAVRVADYDVRLVGARLLEIYTSALRKRNNLP